MKNFTIMKKAKTANLFGVDAIPYSRFFHFLLLSKNHAKNNVKIMLKKSEKNLFSNAECCTFANA